MAGAQRQNIRGVIMIELTEIISEPNSYNPDTQRVSATYSLKSLYINPRFVVELRENEEIAKKHSDKKLIGGLSKDVGFTKVVVSSGGNWTKTYNIVGYPAQVLSALKETK